MAWPKGRKLSASHKAAISRSLKGKARAGGRAARATGRASGLIVKRTLGNKQVQGALLAGATGFALNAGIGAAGRVARRRANAPYHATRLLVRDGKAATYTPERNSFSNTKGIRRNERVAGSLLRQLEGTQRSVRLRHSANPAIRHLYGNTYGGSRIRGVK